jgi:hypothetical protein
MLTHSSPRKLLVFNDDEIDISKQLNDVTYRFDTTYVPVIDFDRPFSSDDLRRDFATASAVMMIFNVASSINKTQEKLNKNLRIVSIFGGPFFTKPIMIVGDGDSSVNVNMVQSWSSGLRNIIDSSFKRFGIKCEPFDSISRHGWKSIVEDLDKM